MKQSNTLLIAAAMVVALFMATINANAGGKSPGESFYVGAFFGHGTGIVSAKVNVLAAASAATTPTATYDTERGGLGLSGIQGGGWAGWGMKTADDLYFGTEISFAGSDEKIELTSSQSLTEGATASAITSATAKRNWVSGGSVRVGYYVNSDTLLALSGGIAVSQFDVDIGEDSNTYYAGGPQIGASLTTNLSKIDPNLGLRMEFVYTDYLTAETNGFEGVNVNGAGSSGTGNDSELTGSDQAGRIGITYRF